MKLVRIALVLLLVAGCLGCSGSGGPGQHFGGGYSDFEVFKADRMKLPERQDSVSLVAVGDIMLSRGVAQKIKEHGDPSHPFAGLEWFLQSGDVAFGNLEGPVTPGREIKMPEMVFRADTGAAPALKAAGIDILSLANNHVPDFGVRGILDTMHYLDNVGISYTGAGRNREEAYAPRYMDINGVRLAFLAFNDSAVVPDSYRAGAGPGTAVLESKKMTGVIKEAIKRAGENADFTVVSLHAGTEYAPEPDGTQVSFARQAIDAGADLVLGHHPHVVQKVERYRGKYILYSLGNFVFDQLWSRDTREGVAAKIWISENHVEKIEFLPLYINDETRPVALNGQEGRRVLEKLELELELDMTPEQYVFRDRTPPPEYRLVKQRQFDLNEDGTPEKIILRDGRIKVQVSSGTIWRSPEDWWVDYFFLGDATNDGSLELNLLVWKQGSFGPQRPFWVEGEDKEINNHLFIFKLEKGSIIPVWQSSTLDCPNYRAALLDINGDGENELVAVEGSYTDPEKRKETLWKWNGWGFSRL